MRDYLALLAAVGHLEHLRTRLCLNTMFNPLNFKGLALVLPASRALEPFEVALWMDDEEPEVQLPQCQIGAVQIYVLGMSQTHLTAALRALASYSHFIALVVAIRPFTSRALLEPGIITSVLEPFITSDRLINLVIDQPAVGTLVAEAALGVVPPGDTGFIFISAKESNGLTIREWWIGGGDQVAKAARDHISKWAKASASELLWARRGKKWSDQEVNELNSLACASGLSIEWIE